MELAAKKFKTMDFKGKQYVTVAERIKYLRFEFDGDYAIRTQFQYYEKPRVWVVRATLILIQGDMRLTYTGCASEVESDDYKKVNHTSALENEETSAVGRACAMAGIGIEEGIASANEMKGIERKAAAKQANAKPEPTKTVSVIPDEDPKEAELKSLIDTTTQIDSLDKWNQFANKFSSWQGVEGFDLAMKAAYDRLKNVVQQVTINQKTQILLLLNNSVITKEEKEKATAKLNKLTYDQAQNFIAKIKETIRERTPQAA